ncbi:hypothetical protein ACIGW4_22015 [Streptomyces sp. NPDC053513]|uniref:hypothetical protein n=1 Tax=unclassified Streptomyces TaxID=2593676 RepID=UPI0037CFFA7D
MTAEMNRYADFDGLRKQAVALRREGLSLRQIRDHLKIYNNDLLHRLVKGEPPPEWTKRPNAKDDLRDRARELRLQGMTYDQIQVELGCSKSSISLWVRDLPKPSARKKAPEIAKRDRTPRQRLSNEDRQRATAAAAAEIGYLSDRELFLLGVALYWAEGAKPRPHERITFVNSDPDMIRLFLRWLRLVGVPENRLRFFVQVHETADVAAVEAYWADVAGATPEQFGKTSVKKHNPKTNRKNVGADYHGCLSVRVLQGADLYRRIEGSWYGIVGAASAPTRKNRT